MCNFDDMFEFPRLLFHFRGQEQGGWRYYLQNCMETFFIGNYEKWQNLILGCTSIVVLCNAILTFLWNLVKEWCI